MPFQPTCTLFHLGPNLPFYVVHHGAEAVARAAKLRDSPAGPVWIYSWQGNEYEFGFGKSGELELM